jgi:hypothetical protein
LDCAKTHSRNVLIVTRDSDFGLYQKGYLNDWLAQEFKAITKRKAELLPSLSQALKKLDVKVTEAEEKVEQSIISKLVQADVETALELDTFAAYQSAFMSAKFPVYWEKLKFMVSNKYPSASEHLNDVISVHHTHDVLTLNFTNPVRAKLCSTSLMGIQLSAQIQSALKEMGYSGTQKIKYGVQSILADLLSSPHLRSPE